MISHEDILKIKAIYPKGTRIRLNRMDDPYAPVEPGTEGEVVSVDDIKNNST